MALADEFTDQTARLVNSGILFNPAVPPNFLAPDGITYESYDRQEGGSVGTAVTLTSGTLSLHAIPLPKGAHVGRITFVSGTVAGATLTHQWFCLVDRSRKLLAITADATSAAWAASTAKTLTIATTAAGAMTDYVAPYTGMYYIGCLVTATTVPNLEGLAVGAGVRAMPPALSGNSSTGLTTPSTFATTYAAITAGAGLAYTGVGAP